MKCPGQDTRYWQPEAIFEIACPWCNHSVEFFKDESTRRCKHCGHKIVNPKIDFGCAAYCKYAEQCLGDVPPELLAEKKDLLKDRVAIEMKRYFGKDFRRINHARRVAHYAEQILKAQGGGDAAVVLSAAYLHDIGIHEAERKYGSTEGRYQEEEGRPIAREILERLGAPRQLIEEVEDIVGHHHHPRSEETLNFKVVYDADMIVNLEDKHTEAPENEERMSGIIDKVFLTHHGKELARKRFLRGAGKGVNNEGTT